MSTSSGSRQGAERERYLFALTPLLWLGFLAWSVGDVIAGRDRPRVVAASLILAYAALYVWLVWLEYAEGERGRQRPRLGLLAVMVPLAAALVIAYGASVVFALMYLSAALVMALPRRQALLAVAADAVAMLAVCLHTRQSAVNTAVFLFVVFLTAALLFAQRGIRRLIDDLHAAREELARLAVDQERLRFARDLHDLLGHSLSLIVVKTRVAQRLIETGKGVEAVAREVREIEQVAQQSLAEVREAVTGYRRRSLGAELDGARAALAAAGIDAVVRTSGTPLPAETDALLGWAVREAVTNVVRHSRARRCEIEVRGLRAGSGDHRATLEVRNDGPVVSAGGDGNGLRGLAERVEAAGGTLHAGPRASGGWRLAVSVPLVPAGTAQVPGATPAAGPAGG